MFRRLSIRSKVILVILAASILATVVTATIGYRTGKTALTKAISNELTSIRAAKAEEVENLFRGIENHIESLSRSMMTAEAMGEFADGFHRFQEVDLPADAAQSLQPAYGDFIADLAAHVEGDPQVEMYMPTDPRTLHVQQRYIADNPHPAGERHKLEASGRDSRYDRAHAYYHDRFADISHRFEYYDLFLIEAESLHIVYSVEKEVDLGTSLKSGPYRNTNLARAAEAAIRLSDPGSSVLVDFELYTPSAAAPAAFIASPIVDNHKVIGVLAFQLPVDEINREMTGGQMWNEIGLGDTGEVYLVGPDRTLRSISRFFVETPDVYFDSLRRVGLSEHDVDVIQRQGTPILRQPVDTDPVNRAFRGERDMIETTDYRGTPVLSAFAPVSLGALNWVILAEIDAAEAYAPIGTFARQVLIAATGLVILLTLAAMWLAWVGTRPVRQLTDAAERVAQGERNLVVTVNTQDEFNDLAMAFNTMLDSLRAQQEALEQKNQENEALLLSILPGPVAERLKQGEENIADNFASVTVMFGEILGFSEWSARQPPEEAIVFLNNLVNAFDGAAEANGVEKVKTIGAGYMAVCGLTVPRVDHIQRVVEFAREIVRIVERTNQREGTDFRIGIGVNTGPVVAGVVGRGKFIYDLWGDTVTIADRFQAAAGQHSVIVTEPVYERTADLYTYQKLAAIDVPGREAVEAFAVGAPRESTAADNGDADGRVS